MKHYIKLNVDRTCSLISTKEQLSLKEMQSAVGGTIEFDWRPTVWDSYEMAIEYPEFVVMVNEDGFGENLERNPFFPKYVGNIVVGEMVKGDDGFDFIGFDDSHPFIKGADKYPYSEEFHQLIHEMIATGLAFGKVSEEPRKGGDK